MSITTELREWVKSLYTPNSGELKLQAERIADNIDAELAERYMELPVDADGVPIRARDKMCQIRRDGTLADPFEVAGFELVAGELWPVEKSVGYKNSVNPRYLRHYHELTVEDVLEEFAEKVIDSQIPDVHPTYEEAIAEYAKRLRLAGDGE